MARVYAHRLPLCPGTRDRGSRPRIGSAVKKFKEGDFAAVGCMVDSCGICPNCREGLEQYCDNGFTLTYNGEDKILGGVTYGGYSDSIVVDEAFVLRVSPKVDLAPRRPCSAQESPRIRRCGTGMLQKGQKVGIVGLGGLGHMGVKFAHAFGAHTVLFTTSPNKSADAKRMGADEIVISKNAAEMQKHADSFDFILDTVSAEHDLNAYLNLLKLDGTMTSGGSAAPTAGVQTFGLLMKRRQLAGSGIGGIRETQEMLDFCAEHGITADVELIPIQQINEAYERLLKSDVKYRFVIDMGSLR